MEDRIFKRNFPFMCNSNYTPLSHKMKKKKSKKANHSQVRKNSLSVSKKLLKKNHFQEFYQQMLKVAPLVLEILKKNAASRDDDNLLFILVWKAQGMKETSSCKNFKYKLVRGIFSTPETISRARRKIQFSEKHKHLRGTIYHQRQLAESKLRNQLSLW
jgi:hypothetical protein